MDRLSLVKAYRTAFEPLPSLREAIDAVDAGWRPGDPRGIPEVVKNWQVICVGILKSNAASLRYVVSDRMKQKDAETKRDNFAKGASFLANEGGPFHFVSDTSVGFIRVEEFASLQFFVENI